jgi:hypothetical protein
MGPLDPFPAFRRELFGINPGDAIAALIAFFGQINALIDFKGDANSGMPPFKSTQREGIIGVQEIVYRVLLAAGFSGAHRNRDFLNFFTMEDRGLLPLGEWDRGRGMNRKGHDARPS